MDKHDIIHSLIKINNGLIKARQVAKSYKNKSECAGCETLYALLNDLILDVVNLGDNLHYGEV